VDHGEVDVDLETRAIPVISGEPGEPGEIDGLDDLGSMMLVGLDDDRVTRDPTQSGPLAVVAQRALTASPLPPRSTTAPQRTASSALRPPPRPAAITGPRGGVLFASELEAAIAAIDRAAEPSAATEIAMGYVGARFHHAVLFSIHGGLALGDRGH